MAIEPASEPYSASPRAHRGHRWGSDLIFFAIAAGIVVSDQVTKALIRSNLSYGEVWPEDGAIITIFGIPLRFIYVTNSGAAFGILQGQTTFLLVTGLVGLAAILLYYIYPPMDHGLIKVALGMQLGGAIGNLIDRLRFSAVTDWVDFGGFPTFNIADAAISISIATVLIFFITQDIEPRRHKPPDPAHAPARED